MKYLSAQPFGVGSTSPYRDRFDQVFGPKCDHGTPLSKPCHTCEGLRRAEAKYRAGRE